VLSKKIERLERFGMIQTIMSATEVIELYEALPAQEQRIVAEHIGKESSATVSETKLQGDFTELVNRVFDKHSQLMERLAQ